MAYITKFDGKVDSTIKIGGEGNPTSIEGYFLGSKDTMSDYGPGKLHIFQTKDGVIGVWGKTRMNNLLTSDLRGQMCLVSFTGMVAPAKKGRKPSYGYKLQHDPENTTDVSNISLSAAASEEDEDSNESSSYESDGSSDEDTSYDEVQPTRPVAPRVAAAAPSADRQARMQALLNKGRSNKSA